MMRGATPMPMWELWLWGCFLGGGRARCYGFFSHFLHENSHSAKRPNVDVINMLALGAAHAAAAAPHHSRTKSSSCRVHCTDDCHNKEGRPLHKDGRCSDGWLGDEMAEGKASCTLGADCSDCGARELCTVPGGSPHLLLPKATLPSPAVKLPTLRASEVLIMILGSTRFRHKSERAYHSWCRQWPDVACLFFGDDHTDASSQFGPRGPAGTEPGESSGAERADGGGGGSGAEEEMPWVVVKGSAPPAHCCAKKRSGSGKLRPNFFCTPHRAKTLRAQYRYMPALMHVQRSPAIRSGGFRWVVVVDDDAFVFVPRLLWILARLNSSAPLYLGDFGSSGEAVALRPSIPHFACGGGGSVLSIGALQAMDLSGCHRDYHKRCMQSDWMIGGCARRHGVMELRELGCGTCDPRRIRERRYVDGVRQRLQEDRCFFLQQASPVAQELPLGRHSGAIVHGLDEANAAAFFRKHNGTASPRAPTAAAPARMTTSRVGQRASAGAAGRGRGDDAADDHGRPRGPRKPKPGPHTKPRRSNAL